MKTILCFGDSNTWGEPPGGGDRYGFDIRWPGLLQKKLGVEYRVVEEGLCGRTTCFDDPFWPHRNGLSYLPIALESHSPIDLLIITLGTNDVKARYNQSAYTIAQGVNTLIEFAQKFEPRIKDILIVSPQHVTTTDNHEITQAFDGSIEKSKELAQYYEYFAKQRGVRFFDAASVAKSSPVDGVHLDAENHALLAEGVFNLIRSFPTT